MGMTRLAGGIFIAAILCALSGQASAEADSSVQTAIERMHEDPERAAAVLRQAAPGDLRAAFHLIVALDVWLPRTVGSVAELREVAAEAVATMRAMPTDGTPWPYLPNWMTGQRIETKGALEQADVFDLLRHISLRMADYHSGSFLVNCKVLNKRPAYMDLARSYFGDRRDSLLPSFSCDKDDLALPQEVERYLKVIAGRSDISVPPGWIRYTYYREYDAERQAIRVAPRALLQGYRRVDMTASHRPLETWSMLNLSNRAEYEPLAAAYDEALPVLVEHYRRSAGLSEADALQAARIALLMPAYEGHWAAPDRSGLRYLILEGAPLGEIVALIDAAPDSASVPMTVMRMQYYDGAWDYVGTNPDPLISVAVHRPDVLELLLEKGSFAPPLVTDLARGDQTVDPNARNAIGKTPLMTAAELNQVDSVRILLAHGADPNAAIHHPLLWHSRRTALMYAAAKASAPVIELLLAGGADPEALDSQGFGILDYLQGRGPTGPNPMLPASGIARLADRFPVTERTREQQTALMRAAATEDGELVVQLLDAGSDKAARDARGLKALDYAEGRSPLGHLESNRFSGYPSPGLYLDD